jgi:hypothetical protein
MGKYAWTLLVLALGSACSGEEKTPSPQDGGESGAGTGGEAPSTAGMASAGEPSDGGSGGKGTTPSDAGQAGAPPVVDGGAGVGGEPDRPGGAGGRGGSGPGGGASGGAGVGGGAAGSGGKGGGGAGGAEPVPWSVNCEERTGANPAQLCGGATFPQPKVWLCRNEATPPRPPCVSSANQPAGDGESSWCGLQCMRDAGRDWGKPYAACPQDKPVFTSCVGSFPVPQACVAPVLYAGMCCPG